MVGGSREGSARLGCSRLTGLRRPRTTHGDGSTQLVVAFTRRARRALSINVPLRSRHSVRSFRLVGRVALVSLGTHRSAISRYRDDREV